MWAFIYMLYKLSEFLDKATFKPQITWEYLEETFLVLRRKLAPMNPSLSSRRNNQTWRSLNEAPTTLKY